MHQANLFNLLNASSYELPFFKAHQKTIHNCTIAGQVVIKMAAVLELTKTL